MTQNTRPDLTRMDTKQFFFASYWGQKVLFLSKKQPYPFKNTFAKSIRHGDYLLLTPLSHITDEDAKAIAQIECENTSYHTAGCGKNLVQEFIEDGTIYYPLIDFLRFKGYALPWMGYTVQELIEAGYCQLKGGEQNG